MFNFTPKEVYLCLFSVAKYTSFFHYFHGSPKHLNLYLSLSLQTLLVVIGIESFNFIYFPISRNDAAFHFTKMYLLTACKKSYDGLEIFTSFQCYTLGTTTQVPNY